MDFTVEVFAYPLSPLTGGTKSIIGMWSDVDSNGQSWIMYLYNGSLRVLGDIVSNDNVFFNVSNVITQEKWYHIAWTRSASTMYLFLDGSQIATYNCGTSAFSVGTNTWGVGGFNSGSGSNYIFNGYLDELRITRGIARYTSSFTIPFIPFANQ